MGYKVPEEVINNPTIRELYEHLKTMSVPALAKKTGNFMLYESLLAGQASRVAQGEFVTESIATLDQTTIEEIEKIQSKGELSQEEKEFLIYVDILRYAENNLITIKFIGQLVKEVPELQPLLDEHIHNNSDHLPYVFMGDVRRFVVAEAESNRLNPTQPVARILKFFEDNLETGGDYMRGFIHTSFTDNFPDKDPILQQLLPLIRPLYLEQLKAEDKI